MTNGVALSSGQLNVFQFCYYFLKESPFSIGMAIWGPHWFSYWFLYSDNSPGIETFNIKTIVQHKLLSLSAILHFNVKTCISLKYKAYSENLLKCVNFKLLYITSCCYSLLINLF